MRAVLVGVVSEEPSVGLVVLLLPVPSDAAVAVCWALNHRAAKLFQLNHCGISENNGASICRTNVKHYDILVQAEKTCCP